MTAVDRTTPACDGSSHCVAETHIHGCFAERCDHFNVPVERATTAKQRLTLDDLTRYEARVERGIEYVGPQTVDVMMRRLLGEVGSLRVERDSLAAKITAVEALWTDAQNGNRGCITFPELARALSGGEDPKP